MTDRANAESTMMQSMVRYFVMSVSSISGLRYNQKVIAPGAQTERRGDAGPVRSLLRGKPHRPLFFIKTTPNSGRCLAKSRHDIRSGCVILAAVCIRSRCTDWHVMQAAAVTAALRCTAPRRS